MITQVLYNLINNAVNYTGDNKTVIIRQHVANGKVRVSIADSGEGIAPEHIPHIWDRYYKLDKVHRRATVGSGLGLSIVKKVLIRHGASFGVESKLGAGSVFWFELDTVK
jgi:signal transduction histidine kinase